VTKEGKVHHWPSLPVQHRWPGALSCWCEEWSQSSSTGSAAASSLRETPHSALCFCKGSHVRCCLTLCCCSAGSSRLLTATNKIETNVKASRQSID
jgi:hypothetical protein